MRLLLAAMTSPWGEADANADRHVELLGSAAAAGCDLAVFPEMSLTGSVDPVSHPERAATLGDPAVERVVAATRATGVAAVFGIGERLGDAFHITQIHAVDGSIARVQRKRVLGDDEEGFAVATATEQFALGDVPFGVLICAEVHDDATWTRTAATGVELIVVAAAPGLHGRRIDEDAWRDGYDWWQGAGVADARRHAARLGVWVALATQAGSTVDEDFPGGVALIDPTGTVVAALPDGRPGTLVVALPLPTDAAGGEVGRP